MTFNVECFLGLLRLDSLHSHSFPLISTRLNSSSSFSPLGSSSFLLRLLSNCEESHSLHSRVLTCIAAFNMEALSFPSSLLLSPPSHNGFFRLSSPGPKKVQFTTGKFLAFSENRHEFSAQKCLLSFLVQSMSLYIDMNMMRSSKF